MSGKIAFKWQQTLCLCTCVGTRQAQPGSVRQEQRCLTALLYLPRRDLEKVPKGKNLVPPSLNCEKQGLTSFLLSSDGKSLRASFGAAQKLVQQPVSGGDQRFRKVYKLRVVEGPSLLKCVSGHQ